MAQSALILKLKLINYAQRPTHSFRQNGVEILAMLDTGAMVPVWCSSEKALLKAYPDAERVNKKAFISGFGKDKEECTIYKIPKFELTDGSSSYSIEDLYIALCQHPEIGCSLIMSDTMFSKTDTLIKRRKGKFLEIYADSNKFHCTLRYHNAEKFLVSVWSQNEAE